MFQTTLDFARQSNPKITYTKNLIPRRSNFGTFRGRQFFTFSTPYSPIVHTYSRTFSHSPTSLHTAYSPSSSRTRRQKKSCGARRYFERSRHARIVKRAWLKFFIKLAPRAPGLAIPLLYTFGRPADARARRTFEHPLENFSTHFVLPRSLLYFSTHIRTA